MPKTLLLADDSVTIRKVVELTFSDTDIRVESVGSGREALERIAAIQPDLILVDVAMPAPSGYDICRHVKASPRPVPVLLLTGTFEPLDADLVRACGADGQVVKPFESEFLVRAVESALARTERSDPAAERRSTAGAEQELEQELGDVFDELAAATAGETEESAPASCESAADAAVTSPRAHVETQEADPVETATAAPVQKSAESPRPAPRGGGGPAARLAPGEVALELRGATLSAEDIDAIARAVVERVSVAAIREIAWDVVPELAEVIMRERIRQLERDIED